MTPLELIITDYVNLLRNYIAHEHTHAYHIADKAGLSGEALAVVLRGKQRPSLSQIVKVLDVLGYQLVIREKPKTHKDILP